MRHSSQVNLDVKRESRSLMICKGNPNREKMCWMYNMAVPSAVIPLVQGMKMDALVQSWSVTVSIASYFCDLGSFIIKSSAIVLKGFTSGLGVIGASGT